MKYWWILSGLIFVVSCNSKEEQTSTPKTNDSEGIEAQDLKTKAAQHIKGQLKLTAIDKLDTTWFSQDITGDDVKDHIITVNLLDRAINEGIESGKTEKMQEMGYMGYYNFFFVVDGSTDEISDAVVVASSPMFKLNVTFAPILGTGQTDFFVDYRVRNMQRRKFYAYKNGKAKEICQAVVFDGLGTSQREAYDIRIEKGTLNQYNDIVEYQAELEDIIIPNIDSTYTYIPTISSSETEIRRWHFSPAEGKYFMVNK